MRFNAILSLLGLTAAAGAAGSNVLARDYETSDYYVLHIDERTSPEQVAVRLGLKHEGQLGVLKDHHMFSSGKEVHDVVKRELQARKRRKRQLGGRDVLDGVLFSQKQALRKPWEKRIIPQPPANRAKLPANNNDGAAEPVEAALKKQAEVAEKLQIRDPIFKDQWHLFNPVQVGHDVNVTELWLQGVTGKNATVAIVDDGLDMYSNDLKDNFYAKGSYDFNEKTNEPKPRLPDDRHGTRCAGEVSAVRNDVCGVGVAYDSNIAGIRILSKPISDADEALAMNYDFQNNQIYSCSWGPPDDGKSMDAPGILIRRAMLNAVQNGRGGLGSVYVFASGNGALNEDNCNFDGYTNSIYSITVGAVDRKGNHPYYSEKCSASLVVTYSSGGDDAIHTTDVGPNNCYDQHGGTSAAAPLAAGIFALVLQVRPDLSWRDMQYLAMLTAVPVHLDDGEWQDTTMGLKYSHTYAYGKIDSYAMVEAARTWKNVKPQAWLFSPWIHVKEAIPQGTRGLSVSFDVNPDMLKEANLERIEHVTVTMNVAHTRRGDLSVDLVSPDKVISHLSAPRSGDEAEVGYEDWTFMSVVHWGESGLGTWTVIVRDTVENEHAGNFTDFHIKLWGEARDASKATLLPMPTEEDDDDHDAVISSTTTASASSATEKPANEVTATSKPPADPTAQPDRPVKPTGAKPSATSAEPTGTAPPAAETSAPGKPSSSSWLPSFLPTFGVGPRTLIWIYSALGLIVAFCGGLGVYFYLARRKRLRNSPRDDYEFELLDEEEAEGLASGEKRRDLGGSGAGGGGAGGRKTRGGELYDAFAGGSEDEDDDLDDDYSSGSGGAVRAYTDRNGSDERVDEKQQQQQQRERRSADPDLDLDDDEHHVIGDDSEDDVSDDEQDRGLIARR